MTESHTVARARTGAFYAVSAYAFWGLMPIYWHALGPIDAVEIVLHRAVWSTVFVVGLVVATGRWPALREAMGERRRLLALMLSGVLVMGNWSCFIWAVQHGFVLETSLGYYINPLVSVMLGVVVLGDRLGRTRACAVALAAIAVLYLTWSLGVAPWLALFLATTFGLYGLIRKLVPTEPLVGLAIETGFVAPFGLVWMIWAADNGHSAFLADGFGWRELLLVGSGPATALPLVWFAAAASRLSLSSVGFFQYIGPTLQFLLAVFLFGEAFTHAHFVAFLLIWAALALVSWEAIRLHRA